MIRRVVKATPQRLASNRKVSMSAAATPLIAVIGTTGTGKSQLAIELALALSKTPIPSTENGENASWTGGEVVNADAMQVYSGLNIITNKVTPEEMKGVPHHLMGIRNPGEEYHVSEWVHDTIGIVNQCHKAGKVPIIAGGTSYWVQHLLFPNRLVSLDEHNHAQTSENSTTTTAVHPQYSVLQESLASLDASLLNLFENLPSKEIAGSCSAELAFSLHSLLCSLDPPMGARWHWKDTRKVLRSLEILKETGQRASDILMLQDQNNQTTRYRSLIFWLWAEPEKLDLRLDERVDKMTDRGLLNEIQQLRAISSEWHPKGSKNSQEAVETDFTKGIFQTIGYKEFDEYLSQDMPSTELFQDSIKQMKHATRKYARYQIKWMRNKLLPAIRSQHDHLIGASIYLLDATNLEAWQSNVQDIAVDVMRDFLNHRPLQDPLQLSENARKMLAGDTIAIGGSAILKARRKRVCTTCTSDPSQPIMIEEGRQWDEHIRTTMHRNRDGRERRIADQMAMREVKQKERADKRKSLELNKQK